jgi:hypothetical protein
MRVDQFYFFSFQFSDLFDYSQMQVLPLPFSLDMIPDCHET